MDNILYICDRKACETCSHEFTGCMHTEKVDHAINFTYDAGSHCFFEQNAVASRKMMQKVVRTYPDTYTLAYKALSDALADGWRVAVTTNFHVHGNIYGTEYILEKEFEQK